MPKKKRHYTQEFKMEAVRLAESGGKPIIDIEKDLGLSRGLLNRWKKEAQEAGTDAFPGSGQMTPDASELKRLQQENTVLRQERDILKTYNERIASK